MKISYILKHQNFVKHLTFKNTENRTFAFVCYVQYKFGVFKII